MIERCFNCAKEYRTGPADEGLCAPCQRLEAAEYATAAASVVADTEPWRFSRRAMQERLSVSGDRDE